MKTNFIKPLGSCILLVSLIVIGLLTFNSCSSEQAIQKPLSFSDIESEFKFVKPLSENSKKVILKQFGSVENYRDSIHQRKNSPNRKRTIVTGHPTIADSAALKIFKMNNQELEKAGIKVTKDTVKSKPISSIIKRVSSKVQANYLVQIWNAPSNHLYVLNIGDDEYILEHAESFGGDDLPYSCRAGACSTCCSKLISGTLDCSEQSYYDEAQLQAGFFPMCVAYATSDCEIVASKESDLI